MERRSFLEMFLAGTVGFAGMPSTSWSFSDEIDWASISKQYPDSQSKLLNLNNGSAGMMSKPVEDQLLKFISQMNAHPPYEKAIYWEKLTAKSKGLLGEMIDANPEELALVRNTTEAVNFILTGLDIPVNASVVCAHHDYTNFVDALKTLSAKRDYRLKMVDLKMPASEAEILEAYDKQIESNTELVLITAFTHREGQIMPVKKLVKMAKAKGAKVLVDAAHAIGHFEHSIKDWDCDFYATSLHKWLGAPIGTGLLYINKDHIGKVQGSYHINDTLDLNMKKFEAVGTKSFALYAGVLSAIRYHQNIGTQNKHNRLKELTDYWSDGVKHIPMVKTIIPDNYGGVANFHYPGPSKNILGFFKSKDIHFKKVRPPNGNRTTYRISPNIYHSFKDLDRFIDAMKEFSKRI